jgi:hypothetical protein
MRRMSTEELLSRISLGFTIEMALKKDPDPKARKAEKIIRGQRQELEALLKRRGGVTASRAADPDPNGVNIGLQTADLSAVPFP